MGKVFNELEIESERGRTGYTGKKIVKSFGDFHTDLNNFDGIYFSQLLNAKLNEAASIHPHSLFVQLYYIPCLIRAISFIIPFRVHETRSEFFIFLSSPSFAREMIQKQEGISTTTLNSRWICINCCWNLFSEQQQASLLIEKNLSSSFLSHTHERARVLFYHHPTVMMPKASERGDSEESCKWIPLCEQDKQQSHCIVLQPTRDESFFYFAMQFKLSHVLVACNEWKILHGWLFCATEKKNANSWAMRVAEYPWFAQLRGFLL